MENMIDKLLGYIATTAEEVFWESMGLASCSGAYEPEVSDEVKALKPEHISKIESIFDKLMKQ